MLIYKCLLKSTLTSKSTWRCTSAYIHIASGGDIGIKPMTLQYNITTLCTPGGIENYYACIVCSGMLARPVASIIHHIC